MTAIFQPSNKDHSFPFHEWPKDIPPSDQLVTLYESNIAYRTSVQRMIPLLKEGATCTDFRNHSHMGLRKLGNWFKDRKKSFQRKEHYGNDPVLDVWPNIAWHMGPCPLQGKQASVHRVDDLKGYRIGNLEWASKAVQALEKAEGTRKIKWQGKYISDSHLIAKLKAIGITRNQNQIWQFRKNNKAKFPSLDALHKAMLQKWGAYEASTASPSALIPDFFGEAPLEKGLFLPHEWDKRIKARMYKNKSPLELQLDIARELEEEYKWAVSQPENGYTLSLKKKLNEIERFIRQVRYRLDDLATKKLSATHDLVTIGLDKAPDFHLQPVGFSAPAPITPPKQKIDVAPTKPVAQGDGDEEDDKPFFLSGEDLAQHLKELGCS